MERACGVLLPLSSLPSPYGIGSLGQAAFDFVDFLARAGQSWWQLLPIGPTSYGDSPYQSFSAYAGNPYYVDLDRLIQDGLLTEREVRSCDWGADIGRVDYERLYQQRLPLLERAYQRGWGRDRAEVERFVQTHPWLHDYALFMACKRHFGMRAWLAWPDRRLRLREPAALQEYSCLLAADVRLFTYIQFLFYRQWHVLQDYAHQKGIQLIGDIPIYVSADSADIWAEPQFFRLDAEHRPTRVAGVPPDAFTADGQLWGNPLYDWQAMKEDGYGWWIRRVDGASRLYDALRIDHFRGLESYWAVEAGAETARDGLWLPGPGMELVGVLNGWFPQLRFIAEDLGYLTPGVARLLQDSGWPGMKVLQFAFDSREPSSHLPHTCVPNSICYTGTHDNTTLAAFVQEAKAEDIAYAQDYLHVADPDLLPEAILRSGLASVSELFVAPMQDWLGLGAEARINTPGRLGGNWQWRLQPGCLSEDLAQRMRHLARLYGRLPKALAGEKDAALAAETETKY